MSIKLGICQWSIPVKELEEQFAMVADAGLAGIHLCLESDSEGDYPLLNKDLQDKYLALAEKYGLTFTAIGADDLREYSMSNSKDRDKVREIMKAVVKVASVLSIKIIQAASFKSSKIESEYEFRETVVNLKYLCKLAEKEGITIGSENGLDADQQLRLLKEVNCPNLKIYFDTKNPYSMRALDSAEVLTRVYGHVCEVHAKDEGALGEGGTGYEECMSVLLKNNYSGWVNLENKYDRIAAIKGISPFEALKHDVRSLKCNLDI